MILWVPFEYGQWTHSGQFLLVKMIRKVSQSFIAPSQDVIDTRVVLSAKYAQEQGYDFGQINTPNSDIFFILLHYYVSLSPTTILYTRPDQVTTNG